MVRDARYRYYVLSDLAMPDAAFDALLHELEALEAAHAVLRTPDSPTQQVGSPLDEAFPPFEHLEAMIDVNLKGTLYTARATLPHLLRSTAADFVAVASEAGRRGLPGEAVYCASKFGQIGFTRALEGELRERGVRCASVCPGGVHTDFAMGTGRTPDMPILEGMMAAQDVADVVFHVLTRPRHLRILETALRPMSEASWG